MWQNKIERWMGFIFSVLFLFFFIGCSRSQQTPEDHVHTKVHVLRLEPTCISEGRIEYWYCTQCKKVYKDKEEQYEISWEDTKLPKTEHIIEELEEVAPTCETSGLTKGKYCSYCKTIIEEQKVIPATGHHYDLSSYIWEWEDFESANLILTCKDNVDHKGIYKADITKKSIPATCESVGKETYIAHVRIGEEEYIDQKEKILPPIGHEYDLDHIHWIWNEDSSVCAQISCKHDSSHIVNLDASVSTEILPASCTQTGKKIFTATILWEGISYQDIKEGEIPCLGHTFDFTTIQWKWEDTSSAVATVLCTNDKNHKITYDAQITPKEIKPTCTKEGLKIYTAAITVDGITYTNEKEESIPALGHKFNYDIYQWEWTGTEEAMLHFPCINDGSHLDSYSAHISSTTIPATCALEGKIVYTASIILHNKTYTDIKEEILPIDPSNHVYDYENPTWIWTPIVDGYTAKILISCKCGESVLTYDSDSIKENTIVATFEQLGKKEYFAEIRIEDMLYTDTKVEILPIKQYVSTEEEFLRFIQTDTFDLTLKDNITLKESIPLSGNYVSIDLNGYTLSLPDYSLQFTAVHSYIRNGNVEINLNNKIGSYVITSNEKANLLIENVTTFGGINIKNANAIVKNSDITATLYYAICAQAESKVLVENSILRKNYVGNANQFVWIEPAGVEDEVSYTASSLLIDQTILSTSTCATLYNPLIGEKPIFYEDIEIETIDAKDYLLSSLDYKCITLIEDVSFTEEEQIHLNGKGILLDLNGFTLRVPLGMLKVTSLFARIQNGNLKGISYDSTNDILSIENGCQAFLDSIQIVGSIATINSSLSLKDVVITSPISNS